MGNVIRLCALAFGVSKLVSIKSNELTSNMALYNPKVHDMSDSFKLRALKLDKLMDLDETDNAWIELLAEMNKCLHVRHREGDHDECTLGVCAVPSFGGMPEYTRFRLGEWGAVLKKGQV